MLVFWSLLCGLSVLVGFSAAVMLPGTLLIGGFPLALPILLGVIVLSVIVCRVSINMLRRSPYFRRQREAVEAQGRKAPVAAADVPRLRAKPDGAGPSVG